MSENKWLPKISKSDCCQVVANKLKKEYVTVVSYEQNSFDELVGYMGDHSILKIEIETNGNKENFTFFIKCIPHVECQRNFLLEVNGFFKEKQFYGRYLSMLKEHSINILDDVLPACYFVNEELFVFDDLSSKGYETLPSRVPLNVDCIKTTLTALAKLHASALILEELKSFRLTDDFTEELKEVFYRGSESTERAMRSCKTGMKAFIDLTHTEEMKISKDLFTEKIVQGCELQKVFIKPSTKYRNTICHADPWTKNFMFRFEMDKAVNSVIVDFQSYRYSPPAQDVLTFIYSVSDRETRRRHMDELVRFYYKELRGNFEKFNLKDVVSEEEFFESCKYFKQFAIIESLSHCQVVLLRKDIANELFSDPKNVDYVLFENRYQFIKDACIRDSVYRQRNSELIEELRELYEKQILL